MTRLTNGTWVLVADGEKALILENQTDGDNPNLSVVRISQQDNPPAREQATDRPGRAADNGPGQKTALDETDFHRLAKDRFATDMADILYKAAHRGDFDRIVLCASPQVLGTLREALHKEVSDKVVAEIDKTLTNHPIPEIERIVAETIA